MERWQEGKLGKRGLAGTGKNAATIIPYNEPDCAAYPHPKHKTSRYKLLASACCARGLPCCQPQTACSLQLAEVPKEASEKMSTSIWQLEFGEKVGGQSL
jgi:hypothetical protein